jgi:hypothetical protein
VFPANAWTQRREEDSPVFTNTGNKNACAALHKIEIGLKVFSIYENRLNDLNSSIGFLSEAAAKSQSKGANIDYLIATA